jgi:hypothetical protein
MRRRAVELLYVNGGCRHLVLPVSVPVPVSLGSSVHGGDVSVAVGGGGGQYNLAISAKLY